MIIIVLKVTIISLPIVVKTVLPGEQIEEENKGFSGILRDSLTTYISKCSHIKLV